TTVGLHGAMASVTLHDALAIWRRVGTGVRSFGRTAMCTCWGPMPVGGSGLEAGGSTSDPRRLVAAAPAVRRHLTARQFQRRRHRDPTTPRLNCGLWPSTSVFLT